MRRTAWILLLVPAACATTPPRPNEPSPALLKGAEWLLAAQIYDGSWHGHVEGKYRPGPAMTAYVLHALAGMPAGWREANRKKLRAVTDYLEGSIHAHGVVGLDAEDTDFYNYATAFTILAFQELKPRGHEKSVARMAGYLKAAQLNEEKGWKPEDPEYGGWALGGRARPKPDAYRLDISVTRFVLQALAAAGVGADDPVMAKARRFVEGCQNPDGGFIFTPREDSMNKAGSRKSYGSTTADGCISLRIAGSSAERIAAAEAWLERNFTEERVPGFPPDFTPPYQDGLRGYWLAAVTEAMGSKHPEWRARIRTRIEADQRPDGSWASAVALMHENEPIQATAMSVLALTRILR